MIFSPRIDLAYKIAAVGHATQVRKGTQLPYLSHPVHVARLLERAGLSEDVVVAGILHDVLEDLDPDDGATQERFRQVFPALAATSVDPAAFRLALEDFITTSFGHHVAMLVEAVTEVKEQTPEGPGDRKPIPWIDRKRAAVAHLNHASDDVVALKAADVLHNVRSVLQDVAVTGIKYLERFNATSEQTLWYYASIARICHARLSGAGRELALELDAAVEDLAAALALPRPSH